MNKNKYLHIVAFDLPFPPNYGGIIDIYYKIKALHEKGVKVILHTFLYNGKIGAPELETICSGVHYYSRRRFSNPFVGELPYIVATRNDPQLLKNLKADSHPILFEGLHTTYYLNHPSLKKRFKIVRTHNVEHHYYKALEEAETGFFKKYFFRVESERLKIYEQVLEHADVIASISPQESRYYADLFPQTQYLPAFHGNNAVTSICGNGKFILYHGNLGVAENNKAALYLVHEVFSKLDLPCIIAGNNPSKQLQQAVKGNPYITLISKINSEDILKLIQEAHINAMPTFQSTGIKLKLLNALYLGRFCVVNKEMVENTGLDKFCQVGDHALAMADILAKLWAKEFTEADKAMRMGLNECEFNNGKNAIKLESLINAFAPVQ